MTKEQLIERLEKMPDDHEVIFYDHTTDEYLRVDFIEEAKYPKYNSKSLPCIVLS